MPFQVVHRYQRQAARKGQRRRHARAHQERAGQPRPPGVGDRVHIVQRAASLGQHRVGQRQHPANVVAAGQLGHHTAIGLVHLDLAVQRMAQQPGHTVAAGVHQGHTGFVARRFNAEDSHGRQCIGVAVFAYFPNSY